MEQSYRIRAASIEDGQCVKRLLMESKLPVDGVDENLEESYCVAESQSDIIGVAGVEMYGSHGLLRSVAVASLWREKSIGKTLVKDRLFWAKSNGLSDMYLITIDAAQYFKRFGFLSVERNTVPFEIQGSQEFASICPESATVMVRPLSDFTKEPE